MPETTSKLHISVITLFPDIFDNHSKHLPISRAIAKGLVEIEFINLRSFAVDKRGTVDSPPYGGGPGMILRPEPIFDAVNFALKNHPLMKTEVLHTPRQSFTSDQEPQLYSKGIRIAFLTPRGETYNQRKAIEFATSRHLVLICGRYEGMDQRVIDYFTRPNSQTVDLTAQELSIGSYVLSGGEVPAMAIIESVIRLIPGAIDNPQALTNESFNPTRPTETEHPQYSRPEIWQNLKVPQILTSGHHENIDKWKNLSN